MQMLRKPKARVVSSHWGDNDKLCNIITVGYQRELYDRLNMTPAYAYSPFDPLPRSFPVDGEVVNLLRT